MQWRKETLAHAFLPQYPLSVAGTTLELFYSHSLLYHPMFLSTWRIRLLQAGDWHTFS